MQQYSKINSYKGLKIFSMLIVSIGIVYRFYLQFIDWSFNEDEVSLGLDILKHNYFELLKPFDSFQSAPPLFLVLQKLISNVGPSYVSLKILSFSSSSVALIYFQKLIERSGISIITIALLLIFTFNPFVLYHSLTLKQYTFDLTFGLLAVYYFEKRQSFTATYLFFTIGCLLSNAALFFTTSFVIVIFTRNLWLLRKISLLNFLQIRLKESLPFILAPIIYLGFFVWFMAHPGARETKEFMTTYWSFWFVPLNEKIFWWIGVQGYRMTFFFYSSYLLLGLIMLVGFLFGCYSMFRKGNKINLFFIKIFFVAIAVHLILSTLQLYPFSDRLYLYMAPIVLYVAIYGLFFLLTSLNLKENYAGISLLFFSSVVLLFNMSYINYKENDIVALSDQLRYFDNQKVYRTSRADPFINKWVEFTQFPELSKGLISSRSRTKFDSIKKNDLVISRRYKNFGHKFRPVKIEDSLKNFLTKRENKKVISVDGYDIYLIMD